MQFSVSRLAKATVAAVGLSLISAGAIAKDSTKPIVIPYTTGPASWSWLTSLVAYLNTWVTTSNTCLPSDGVRIHA